MDKVLARGLTSRLRDIKPMSSLPPPRLVICTYDSGYTTSGEEPDFHVQTA